MRLVYLTTILTVLTSSHLCAQKYTLGDLEGIYKDGDVKEYFTHVKDIRPTDRGPLWIKMTREMAQKYLDQKLQHFEYTEEDFNFIEELSSWSALKDDEFYQTKRLVYGEKFFLSCFSKEQINEKQQEKSQEVSEESRSKGKLQEINLVANNTKSPTCFRLLTLFWAQTPAIPSSTDAGFRFAKYLNEINTSYDLWPFISRTTKGPPSSFYCKKSFIQEILKKKIDESLFNNLQALDDVALKIALSELADEDCLRELDSSFQQELSSRETHESFIAYTLLRIRRKLNTRDLDLFSLTQLLGGPVTKEIFNESWNRLKELGQNFKRRDLLLTELMRIEPLPGKVFLKEDMKEKGILLGHLEENIPEYSSLYAKKCLDYLKNPQHFPKGNPTMECRELLKTSKNNKLSISQQTLKDIENSLNSFKK